MRASIFHQTYTSRRMASFTALDAAVPGLDPSLSRLLLAIATVRIHECEGYAQVAAEYMSFLVAPGVQEGGRMPANWGCPHQVRD